MHEKTKTAITLWQTEVPKLKGHLMAPEAKPSRKHQKSLKTSTKQHKISKSGEESKCRKENKPRKDIKEIIPNHEFLHHEQIQKCVSYSNSEKNDNDFKIDIDWKDDTIDNAKNVL